MGQSYRVGGVRGTPDPTAGPAWARMGHVSETTGQLRARPKLVAGGAGADAAIAFYEAVLDARTTARHTMAGAVVFAQLELPSGDVVQVKDADAVDPAPPAAGGGLVMDLLCDDPDAVVARAVEHGAEVVFEVTDQPYGSRQGRFRDPFGHHWIVGTPITLTDEEVQRALDDMQAGSG